MGQNCFYKGILKVISFGYQRLSCEFKPNDIYLIWNGYTCISILQRFILIVYMFYYFPEMLVIRIYDIKKTTEYIKIYNHWEIKY